MTAIEQAARLYDAHGMSLAQDLERYIKFGYVFVTPDRVLLARPITRSRGSDHWLTDHGEADTWYVKLAVGGSGIRYFVEQIPYYLPFLAWRREFKERADGLRYYATDRITNFLYGKHSR